MAPLTILQLDGGKEQHSSSSSGCGYTVHWGAALGHVVQH
jgi:hypothetical protein